MGCRSFVWQIFCLLIMRSTVFLTTLSRIKALTARDQQYKPSRKYLWMIVMQWNFLMRRYTYLTDFNWIIFLLKNLIFYFITIDLYNKHDCNVSLYASYNHFNSLIIVFLRFMNAVEKRTNYENFVRRSCQISHK